MPYSIRKCNCKDSKGKKGKYIVTKKGKSKQLSCHTSKVKAKSAIRARYANESIQNITELTFLKLLYEASKKKRSLSGSHPDESYMPFDEKEFDKVGLSTWHEDREWTKQYLKDMGLL